VQNSVDFHYKFNNVLKFFFVWFMVIPPVSYFSVFYFYRLLNSVLLRFCRPYVSLHDWAIYFSVGAKTVASVRLLSRVYFTYTVSKWRRGIWFCRSAL